MPGARSRNWCFTINNPENNDEPFNWLQRRYVHFQREKGAEGTEHLQGFVVFTNKKSLKYMKTLNSRAHWEIMQGSIKQNIAYCTKEEGRVAGPWFDGECPQQGKRSDLETIREEINAGATMHQVMQEHYGQWIRYHSAFEKHRRMVTPPRSKMTDCHVYYGDTGIGKSTYVMEKYPEAYFHNCTKWWPDYDGQKIVIMDEFYGQLPLSYMLQVINRIPMKVEAKNTEMQLVAELIVITTNHHPRTWYQGVSDVHRRALQRRITKVFTRSKWDEDWIEEDWNSVW